MLWKHERTVIAALEVGTCKVAAAVAELRPDGTLALLGVGDAPSGSVRKCEIVDFATAQRCIHDALVDAERKTDASINEVYLAISGAHIRFTNAKVAIDIDAAHDEIHGDHLQDLRELACRAALPADHALIHDLPQHYILDDSSLTENPVGLASKRLGASFHLVYGLTTRLQTTIRCVKELSVDVKNYALSSYATAQAVLTKGQKQMGAIVIDCGGGVTDYIVYDRGAVVHSGVLGLGGEHLTNDIAAGLKLPYPKAEFLKVHEGCVLVDEKRGEEKITVPGAGLNKEDRTVLRESLETIMQARQEEILELILEDLQAQPWWSDFNGTVYFTGGASQTRGLLDLASLVFPLPVTLAHQFPFEGNQHYANRPDLSTVIGLLRYARRVEMETPPARGWARMTQSLRKVLSTIRLI